MLKKNKIGLLAVVVCLVALVYAWDQSTAEQKSNVGVLDLELVWSQKVLPTLELVMQPEIQRLQQELDSRIALITEESEKQSLYEQYQEILLNIQQEQLDIVLAKVQKTVEIVAEKMGIDVVVDKQLVICGGVDITQAVLAELTLEE
jgi:outer membrane protein